jgi:hypothetical protein
MVYECMASFGLPTDLHIISSPNLTRSGGEDYSWSCNIQHETVELDDYMKRSRPATKYDIFIGVHQIHDIDLLELLEYRFTFDR